MSRYTPVRFDGESTQPRFVELSLDTWMEGTYLRTNGLLIILRLLDGEVVYAWHGESTAVHRAALCRNLEVGVLPGERIRINACEVQVYGPGPL